MGRIIRDQQKDRLPIIGNIRVGEKNEKGYPTSVDYFIPDGDYAESLLKTLGEDKPSILHITFLSNDDDFSCDERYELWSGKRLYAYGDGVEFYEHNEKIDNYEVKSIEQFPGIKEQILSRCRAASDQKHPPEWSAVLKLRFHILEFKEVAGVWQFSTRGEKSTIKEIVSSYDMVKNFTGGHIVGIPFDLKVKKVVSNKPGSSHSYPVVSLLALIGTEALERVRELLEHNVALRGLITPEKLAAIPEKTEVTVVQNQITASTPAEVDKTPPGASGQEAATDFNRAVFLLENSPDLTLLKDAVKKIKKFKLTREEKSKLDDIYKKVKDGL